MGEARGMHGVDVTVEVQAREVLSREAALRLLDRLGEALGVGARIGHAHARAAAREAAQAGRVELTPADVLDLLDLLVVTEARAEKATAELEAGMARALKVAESQEQRLSVVAQRAREEGAREAMAERDQAATTAAELERKLREEVERSYHLSRERDRFRSKRDQARAEAADVRRRLDEVCALVERLCGNPKGEPMPVLDGVRWLHQIREEIRGDLVAVREILDRAGTVPPAEDLREPLVAGVRRLVEQRDQSRADCEKLGRQLDELKRQSAASGEPAYDDGFVLVHRYGFLDAAGGVADYVKDARVFDTVTGAIGDGSRGTRVMRLMRCGAGWRTEGVVPEPGDERRLRSGPHAGRLARVLTGPLPMGLDGSWWTKVIFADTLERTEVRLSDFDHPVVTLDGSRPLANLRLGPNEEWTRVDYTGPAIVSVLASSVGKPSGARRLTVERLVVRLSGALRGLATIIRVLETVEPGIERVTFRRVPYKAGR